MLTNQCQYASNGTDVWHPLTGVVLQDSCRNSRQRLTFSKLLRGAIWLTECHDADTRLVSVRHSICYGLTDAGAKT